VQKLVFALLARRENPVSQVDPTCDITPWDKV